MGRNRPGCYDPIGRWKSPQRISQWHTLRRMAAIYASVRGRCRDLMPDITAGRKRT
jgi:hypothetical protein